MSDISHARARVLKAFKDFLNDNPLFSTVKEVSIEFSHPQFREPNERVERLLLIARRDEEHIHIVCDNKDCTEWHFE